MYDGYPLADEDAVATPSTHIGDGNSNRRYDGKAKVYGSDSPPPDFVYESKFILTLGVIQVNDTSITEGNNAPYFLPPPDKTIKIIAGHAWSYTFGEILDWEENPTTISIDLYNAKSFVSFDAETKTLSVPAGVTDKQT